MHRLALFPTAATALLCALPAQAAVELECRFTTECYESEICEQTDYTIRFVQPDGSLALTQIDTDASSEIGMTRRNADGSVSIHAHSDSASMLSVVGAGLEARHVYLIHEGPQLVTYHGTCTGHL